MSHGWIHSLVTRSRVATPNSVNRARRPVGGLFDTRVARLSAINLSGPVVFLVRYWVGRIPSEVSQHPWIRRRHPVEKTVDEDPPALRSKASERCNEPPGSVRDHGGQGGVLIHGRSPHLELDTQDPLRTDAQGRLPLARVRGGLDRRAEAPEQVRMVLREGQQMRAPALLLAVDEEPHVHRKATGHIANRLNGKGLRNRVALRIRRPPRVKLPVADDRVERVRPPFLQRFDGSEILGGVSTTPWSGWVPY